jgi:hypothetical protein
MNDGDIINKLEAPEVTKVKLLQVRQYRLLLTEKRRKKEGKKKEKVILV